MRDIWTPLQKYAEVEPHPTKTFVTPDGREMVDITITLPLEKAEMIWQGYMCARCLEPFDEAYPEKCGVCGFTVKADQRRLLERDFLGEDPTVVGSFPMDREMEHLDRVGYRKKGLMTMPKKLK